MKQIFGSMIVLLSSFSVVASQAQEFKVPAFEPPPQLMERAPNGQMKAMAPLPGVLTPECDPQGSMSRDGQNVMVDLNVVRSDFTINNPDPTDPQPGGLDPVTLRSYGGCKSGPLIEVFPGDTLKVGLHNNLSKDDPSCLETPPPGLSMPPGVGCFNTINLHTHGLHVSPTGNSDNVLLNIAPQTFFPYEINIPTDHPAGTFWYHAHRHGSTAVQVASGASGVLIVRGNKPYVPAENGAPAKPGDIDTILHDANGKAMPEKVFLFQQIAYACFQNDPSLDGGPWQNIFTTEGIYNAAGANAAKPPKAVNAPWVCPVSTPKNFASRGVIENFFLQLDSPTIWDTNGRFTSVNGVVQPTLTVPAGEIQRWRFVHAGIHDTINLQVVKASAATPGAKLLSAAAPLRGNRQQQIALLEAACPTTPQTLIPQFQIADDGLTLTKIHMLSGKSESSSNGSNYLQPGYRSDALIVFPEDGEYCLIDQAAPEQERANNGANGGQGPSEPQLLAYVHVAGGHAVTTDLEEYVEKTLYDNNPKLPVEAREGLKHGDLKPWAPFIDLPPGNAAPQQAAFSITGNATGVFFQINGKSYDPNVINVRRQVNSTDDWILTSSGEPHIFHIHVNPFEIVDVTRTAPDGSQESIYDKDGKCKAEMVPDSQGLANQYCNLYHVFRDTIFVENGYQVHVRTHYDRYIGEFVIHCHILDHEDGGMMMNIEIVPDLTAPGGGLGMAGMKHQH